VSDWQSPIVISVLGKVQDNCARDMDCTTVIINSTCAAGRCSCVPGYLATADRTECIKRELNLSDNC